MGIDPCTDLPYPCEVILTQFYAVRGFELALALGLSNFLLPFVRDDVVHVVMQAPVAECTPLQRIKPDPSAIAAMIEAKRDPLADSCTSQYVRAFRATPQGRSIWFTTHIHLNRLPGIRDLIRSGSPA